ncbi:MAG: Holliday junction resolvase RuvX [Gemmatimonadales bacterium]|jgi:putative Holliday junction resolvase
MGRILALDYGERRIGMAVSDPSGTIAQPLPTLTRRTGRRPPYARILEALQEWEAQTIVIGLPVESSGDEGQPAAAVRSFGDEIARRSGLRVDYWDERFTSARAEREISRLGLSASARRQKERVDAMAATLILQAYLDAQHRS